MDIESITKRATPLSELVTRLTKQVDYIKPVPTEKYINNQIHLHTTDGGKTWTMSLIKNADPPNSTFLQCDARKHEIIGSRLGYDDEPEDVANDITNIILHIPIPSEVTYLILAPDQYDSYVLLSNPKKYMENNKN